MGWRILHSTIRTGSALSELGSILEELSTPHLVLNSLSFSHKSPYQPWTWWTWFISWLFQSGEVFNSCKTLPDLPVANPVSSPFRLPYIHPRLKEPRSYGCQLDRNGMCFPWRGILQLLLMPVSSWPVCQMLAVRILKAWEDIGKHRTCLQEAGQSDTIRIWAYQWVQKFWMGKRLGASR